MPGRGHGAKHGLSPIELTRCLTRPRGCLLCTGRSAGRAFAKDLHNEMVDIVAGMLPTPEGSLLKAKHYLAQEARLSKETPV